MHFDREILLGTCVQFQNQRSLAHSVWERVWAVLVIPGETLWRNSLALLRRLTASIITAFYILFFTIVFILTFIPTFSFELFITLYISVQLKELMIERQNLEYSYNAYLVFYFVISNLCKGIYCLLVCLFVRPRMLILCAVQSHIFLKRLSS